MRLLARSSWSSACPRKHTGVLTSPRYRATRLKVQAKQGGLGDEDVDVAVFRFTLGIPGFEDRMIPRVVGTAGAVMLALNHLLGAQPTPLPQARAEILGAILAGLCVIVPEIEERLREVLPGRGRQKTADTIGGATNVFFLAQDLTDKCKQELAWASFALLRNTNCCGVLLIQGSRALLARGAVGAATVTPGQADASLSAISQDMSRALSSSTELANVCSGQTDALWLPDQAAMSKLGVSSWASIPSGAESVLLQHVRSPTGNGLLLVFSERPRALSDRERSWVGAVASKPLAVLPS